ncbi:DUF2268 domain-containing putative Zn-dependent protease [Sediminibacillus dalangtanensis]|uniref:DUF2268 domain-containing putative Zn-dependent protease n=1 Tax=Sediminibacillus dalangtanensis TaxID=2729421 RepID=UPI001FD830B5|nr:DUF2268 domain-containing putative Zn-dependent protease [Sediminibacillus dalangtanensis]
MELAPNFPEQVLQYTVAHEYHHTIHWESRKDHSRNLLQDVMVEGRAEMFAKQVYPGIEVPWNSALPPGTEKQIWQVLKENKDSTNTGMLDDFFNGNPSKGLPRWSNYKIGYKIIEKYVEENPDVPIEEWTQLPAVEILELSHYQDKFN